MNNEMTTDNMSTEEIIDILKGIVFNGFDRTTSKERQALHLAIKALEERPQGEWNYFAEEMGGIRITGECPNCKQRRIIDNFCSNCGADMRKGGADMRQNNEPDNQITIEEYMQSLKGEN